MKIIGITDTVNACDCCGKTGLARTVCFESNNGLHYIGTTCATKFAKKNGISYGLGAIETIELAKGSSASFNEFVKTMKSKGFGNVKTLSPIFDPVDCVTWVWNDVHVKFTDFAGV